MAKRRRCARCRKDIAHTNYIQLFINGEILKYCPSCADEVKREEAIGVNRAMCDSNICKR